MSELTKLDAMQAEVPVFDVQNICRICMCKNLDMFDLFTKNTEKQDETQFQRISDKISYCINEQITEDSNLPRKICQNCFILVTSAYELKLLVIKSKNIFKQIQNTCSNKNEQKNYDKYFEIDIKDQITMDDIIKRNYDSDNDITQDDNRNFHSDNSIKEETSKSIKDDITQDDKINDVIFDNDISLDDELGSNQKYTLKKCKKAYSEVKPDKQMFGGINKKYFIGKKVSYNNDDVPELKKIKKKPINLASISSLIGHKISNFDSSIQVFLDSFEPVKKKSTYIKVGRRRFKRDAMKQLKTLTDLVIRAPLNEKRERDRRGSGYVEKNRKVKTEGSSMNKSEECICEHCGKTLASRGSMAQHIQSHYPPTYFCDYTECHYRCWKKSSLLRHKLRHSDARPHLCQKCPKSFKSPDQLRHHETHIHSPRARNFKCDYCTKSYLTKAQLKLHFDTKHKDFETHKCEVCGKGFTERQNWRKHMFKHHNITVPHVSSGKKKNIVIY